MPFFKWLGVFLILLTGALLAGLLVSFERRRVRQAEGLLSLVQFLRWQIDCFSKPLPHILAECDGRVLSDCGWQRGAPPRSLLALLDGVTLYLAEDLCRLLYDFAAGLGGSYRAEQLRACDYYLARLSPACDALRRDLPRRERVALVLPPAMALVLILLLL